MADILGFVTNPASSILKGGSVNDLIGGIIPSIGDKTLNFGTQEQAALDSEKGQAIYAGYIDYGMSVHEAAILTVADLVTGDKMADQKAARKKVLQSPLLIAQQKFPTDPTKWPEGVLTITINGQRVKKAKPAVGDPYPSLGNNNVVGPPVGTYAKESGTNWMVIGGVGLAIAVVLFLAFRGGKVG